ncbi:hypothetical protein BdWA1_000245 [Babesia duncani]|uniref:RNA-editing substrate-binding complex 6 protein domain-containing protein n=1 Tax=Babesia duncani TaxID=323732 RepID=A0AAD9UPR1_9APIC|nr:hypothetical protein BdWA1_000245 [Babesia duncani]
MRWRSGSGASQWSKICSEYSTSEVIKTLNRLAQTVSRGTKNAEIKFDSWKNSGQGTSPGQDGGMSNSKYIQPLHKRLISLNRNGSTSPKDVSLAMNAYAKMYQCMQGEIKLQLKQYIKELFPKAQSFMPLMNEQDFSLVLNAMSKLNMFDEQLLMHANHVLETNLNDVSKLTKGNNLISQLTPQSVALILNAFAKANVKMNEQVLTFMIKDYVMENINSFLVKHLVILLHACNKMDVQVSMVLPILDHLDSVLERDKVYTLQLVSTALYTFAKYNIVPRKFLQGLNDGFTSVFFKNATEVQLTNIYHAFAKLNIRNQVIISQLNEAAKPLLSSMTMQGLSIIYYTLSRLDYKHEAPELNVTLLKKILERLQLSKILATTGQLLPIHMINICFGLCINLSNRIKLFQIFLNQLRSLHDFYTRYQQLRNDNLLKNYPDKRRNVLLELIGTQGIYQLHVIILEIIKKHRLDHFNLDLIRYFHCLFEDWNAIVDSKGLGSKSLDSNAFWEHLVEPNIKTSQIHKQVQCTLEEMVKSESKPFILCSEYDALPFTVDIVVSSHL